MEPGTEEGVDRKWGEVEDWLKENWKSDLKAIKVIAAELGLESEFNARKRVYSMRIFCDAACDQDWEPPEAEQEDDEPGDLISYVQGLEGRVSLCLDSWQKQLADRETKEGEKLQGKMLKQASRKVEVWTDVLGYCRMILLLFRPVNGQQTKLSELISGDVAWCVWRSFVGAKQSSWDLSCGDIYVITSQGAGGEYIGSTWTLQGRQKEHWREGSRKKISGRPANTAEAGIQQRYRDAMKQRVYRMMSAQGLAKVSMFAVARVQFVKDKGT
jgi:hypothetical protein